jgi:acetyl-CoA synthetase
MALYTKYLVKSTFNSYEDYFNNFEIVLPDNFNFAFDVLDEIAKEEPDKLALMWAHEDGRERRMTFGEIADLSRRAANVLSDLGIKKGDAVMLVLRRHYTFWIAIMALHRIGAVAVPATHLLTKKDIVYRCENAGIKMIIASCDGDFTKHAEEALPECPTVARLMAVDGAPMGWLDFEKLVSEALPDFPRPAEINVGFDELVVPESEPERFVGLVSGLVADEGRRGEWGRRLEERYKSEFTCERMTARVDAIVWQLYREKCLDKSEGAGSVA